MKSQIAFRDTHHMGETRMYVPTMTTLQRDLGARHRENYWTRNHHSQKSNKHENKDHISSPTIFFISLNTYPNCILFEWCSILNIFLEWFFAAKAWSFSNLTKYFLTKYISTHRTCFWIHKQLLWWFAFQNIILVYLFIW